MPATSAPNFLLPPITESVYSSDYLASLYSRFSVHESSRVRPFPIASSVSLTPVTLLPLPTTDAVESYSSRCQS